MANIKSIHSVCNSIKQYLNNAYEVYPSPFSEVGTTLQDEYPCEFRVMSSSEMVETANMPTTLGLYLYRVMINEHIRTQSFRANQGKVSPLVVDLHFMVSVWATSADAEHTICAWVMNQLHQNPILDVSSLTREGNWNNADVIQIIPAELSNEDMMRIWDTLSPDYRLSLSYIARVIQIDPDDDHEGMPVVATRFQYEESDGNAN